MRKITRTNENLFDNLFIDLSDKIVPFFYKYKVSPNFITTIALILGILSVYFFLNRRFNIAAILFLLSYLFDCVDGHYARTYNLCTKEGDYYDHVCDFYKLILLVAAFYVVDKEKFKKVLPLIVIFLIPVLIHLNCQEKIYDNFEFGSSLNICSIFKFITKENSVSFIKLTRHFGVGTYTFLLFGIILWYGK